MTAIATDRNTVRYEGQVASHKLAASTTIYNGTMVSLNASGYLISATGAATETFAGIADQGTDNSAGSAGDLSCIVRKVGTFEMVCSGLTIADIGKDLYLTDNQTVTLTPGTMRVGKLAFFKSATNAPLAIDLEGGLDSVAALAPGSLFVLSAVHPGAVGSSLKTIMNGFKMPVAFKVLRGYAEALTAPSSTYNCTITITDGATPSAFTIATTATHGEDEAINQVYAADTDIDITLIDDNASGTTADVNVMYVCQAL